MQPSGSDNFADKLFTPGRFGILLALLVFAAFPQVILGPETFIARDFGFFVENRLRAQFGLEGVPLVIDFKGKK